MGVCSECCYYYIVLQKPIFETVKKYEFAAFPEILHFHVSNEHF